MEAGRHTYGLHTRTSQETSTTPSSSTGRRHQSLDQGAAIEYECSLVSGERQVLTNLHGLAQAHVIGNQRSAIVPQCKPDAFPLKSARPPEKKTQFIGDRSPRSRPHVALDKSHSHGNESEKFPPIFQCTTVQEQVSQEDSLVEPVPCVRWNALSDE